MTIFGNRDSGYGSSPVAGAVPSLDDLDPPTAPTRGFGAPDPRRVILRVHGGDDIVVGSAEGRRVPSRSPATWCAISSRPRGGASGLRSMSGSSARARSSRSTSSPE